MRYDFMHPADQLVTFMNRIYQNGMTTTSGGNLSVLDVNGDIWITPGGTDKGSLSRGDMVRIQPDGTVISHLQPSSELPFHQAIYQSRSNIRAILHAHSPSLMTFSMMHQVPNVYLIPNTRILCGNIVLAPYAMMGSEELGTVLAREFKKGYSAVLMENHGICVAAESMRKAYAIFETLEMAAYTELRARRYGALRELNEDQIDLARTKEHTRMSEFASRARTSEELALRRDLTRLISRALDQQLFSASQGTISARLPDGSFLITPFGRDRRLMDEEDLVLVRKGLKEIGQTPSRAVFIHEMIYHRNPTVQAIISAQPPNILAFTIADIPFDPSTLPESYVLLHQVPLAPYGFNYLEPQKTAALFSDATPMILLENDGIIVTGKDLTQAFDRLEVAEFTARSILSVPPATQIYPLSGSQKDELDARYHY